MLSTTSEYAVRALAHMARKPAGTAMLGRDLAQAANVPPNFLAKILLALKNAGILSTARGTGGGYTLRKPANEIYLVDVVEVFQSCRLKPLCLMRADRQCSSEHPCTAHERWSQVSAAFTGFLLSTTIADIALPEPAGGDRRKNKRTAVPAPARVASWL